MNQNPHIPLMDRIRYVGYGLIGGLVIGAFLGWMFHVWVGFIVRLFIVIVFLIPLVLAIYFWRRVTVRPDPPPDPSVRDADWSEIEAGERRRR